LKCHSHANSRETGFWELGGAADAECLKRITASPEGRGLRFPFKEETEAQVALTFLIMACMRFAVRVLEATSFCRERS
jgi:hypothetical protein